ncbi:MAG: hypothetical protein D6820_02160, partial [Lentisphaerae bacterium]
AELLQIPTDAILPAARYYQNVMHTVPRPAPHHLAQLDLLVYLPADILAKVDYASMAFSLEARSPFLDHHLAEYAISLPFHYKQNLVRRKHILTLACRDLIPPPILSRRKMGFGVPVASWLRTSWREPVADIILSPSPVFPLHLPTVHRIWNEHQRGQNDHSYLIFALLALRLWEPR